MKHVIFSILLALMPLSALRAQDWYFSMGVGYTHSLAENMSAKELNVKAPPSGMLSIGNNFTSVMGARLQVALRPQKGMAALPDAPGILPAVYEKYGRYSFLTTTADLDLTFNLTNMFVGEEPMRDFEMNLLVGGGVLNSFSFSKKLEDWEYYPVDMTEKSYITANIGIQGLIRLNRRWRALMEIKCYGVDNAYNGVLTSNKFDFFLDLHLGVLCYFNGKRRAEILPVEIRHNYVPEYVNAPVFSPNGATLRNVQFYLQRTNLVTSQLALIADVADYMLAHPDYRLRLCGYPDDENYNEDSNAVMAKRRVEAVREELISMGVADDRIEVLISKKPVLPIREAKDWVTGVTFELLK